MQPSPTSSGTPLIQKLIFVTLLLNLVCLIVLLGLTVVKDLTTNTPRDAEVATPEATVIAVAEPDVIRQDSVRSVPPRTNQSRLTNRPSIQPTRTVAAAPEPVLASAEEPVTTVIPPLPARVVDARTAVVFEEGARAGESVSVSGRVTLRGQPPPEVPIDTGPQCGVLLHRPENLSTRHYVVSPQGELANVFILVSKTGVANSDAFVPGADSQALYELSTIKVTPLGGSVLLDQKNCMYEPYVMAMQQDQPFRVRNSDAVLHNVHLTPRHNREVNFAQPLKQVNSLKFTAAESFIRFKCDVHPWMFAYVSVVPHPFFSVTSTNGTYQIPRGLPDGEYVVTAAHLKLGRKSTGVTIRNGTSSPADIEFSAPDVVNRHALGRPRL